MRTIDFWMYVGKWSAIGTAAFLLMVAAAAATKTIRLLRDADGELRKPMPLAGWLVIIGFVTSIVSFFLCAAYYGLRLKGLAPEFWQLFLMNFVVMMLICLFDTFILDILVIVCWHPNFLKLPDSEAYRSAAYHLRTLAPAAGYSLVFALISSLAAWLIFF